MISAVSDAAADRVVAEWTAWVKTPDAPGGSAPGEAVHQPADSAGADVDQAGQAEQGDKRGE
jgi:hypothetical protein